MIGQGMFNLKDKSRTSRSGEDKIRGLMGWLSYCDKLYKVRKFKPSSRIDREIPTEHYMRSAWTAFWAGFFVWGYLVVSGGIPFYFRLFRKIQVTSKLFRGILISSYLGCFTSVCILLRVITSDKAFIQVDEWIDKAANIQYVGHILKKLLLIVFDGMVYFRKNLGSITIIFLVSLGFSVIVYLLTKRIKENYV